MSKKIHMSEFSSPADVQSNYGNFRDCVSGPIIQKLLIAPAKPLKRKTAREGRNSAAKLSATDDLSVENEADDFADFIDVS